MWEILLNLFFLSVWQVVVGFDKIILLGFGWEGELLKGLFICLFFFGEAKLSIISEKTQPRKIQFLRTFGVGPFFFFFGSNQRERYFSMEHGRWKVARRSLHQLPQPPPETFDDDNPQPPKINWSPWKFFWESFKPTHPPPPSWCNPKTITFPTNLLHHLFCLPLHHICRTQWPNPLPKFTTPSSLWSPTLWFLAPSDGSTPPDGYGGAWLSFFSFLSAQKALSLFSFSSFPTEPPSTPQSPPSLFIAQAKLVTERLQQSQGSYQQFTFEQCLCLLSFLFIPLFSPPPLLPLSESPSHLFHKTKPHTIWDSCFPLFEIKKVEKILFSTEKKEATP